MEVREFTVTRDDDGIVLTGVTHAPITWETSVVVGTEDVGDILRLLLRPTVLGLGMRWLVHRRHRSVEVSSGQTAPPVGARRGGTPLDAVPSVATPGAAPSESAPLASATGAHRWSGARLPAARGQLVLAADDEASEPEARG